MPEHQNVATIRSLYEAFGRGDIPSILDRLDPAVEWRTPAAVPFSKGLYRGPGEVARFFAGIAEHIAESTVEVWDVSSRRRVRTLRFDEPVIARFGPDGRSLAVGTRSGRSQVWSTETWKPRTRFLAGDGGGILTAAISRDGRTLVTAGMTGTVRLWDIQTQQAIGSPLPGVPSVEAGAQVTPDGARLIAAYANGRAFLWDLRPERLLRQACEVAGRRLTRAEWAEFLPGRDYDPAC